MSRVESTRHKVDYINDNIKSQHEIHKVNPGCINTPWLSVYIASLILFTVSIQLSLFFASIWPYVQTVSLLFRYPTNSYD